MNYSVKEWKDRNNILLMDYSDSFASLKDISVRSMEGVNDGFSFKIRKEWFDNIMINFVKYTNTKKTSVVAVNDTPIVEMCFALKGEAFATSGQSKKLFSKGQHNSFYYGQDEIVYDFVGEKSSVEVFEILLTTAYFFKLSNTDCSGLARICDYIGKYENTSMSNHHQPITLPMQKIISDIFYCDKIGSLKRLFLESRVLELLMLQVEQLSLSKPSTSHIKAYDMEKLYYLKEILDQNICTPCSLIDLAHQAGLNEFKLKRGFREIFDNTVFGYLNDIRMQKAKTMLLEEKLNINDIADFCGFQHSKNFVVAFKKYWGMAPTQMLK